MSTTKMRSQEEIQQIRELPKRFTDALDDLKATLETIPTKVRRVVKVGEECGIPTKLVRSLIKQALEGVISERSIYRLLQEVKPREKVQRDLEKISDSLADNVANNDPEYDPVYVYLNCTRCQKPIGVADEKPGAMLVYCFGCAPKRPEPEQE